MLYPSSANLPAPLTLPGQMLGQVFRPKPVPGTSVVFTGETR